MAELTIPDLTDDVAAQLRERAASHGRTEADEAREILANVLARTTRLGWAGAAAIRDQLAATGRTFTDSVEDIRAMRGGG